MYIDAHLHIADLAECFQFSEAKLENALRFEEVAFCTSAHSSLDFDFARDFCSKKSLNAFFSLGIHPQAPNLDELGFLEASIKQKKVKAIGEIGFDLYDDYYKSLLDKQKKAWNIQIELAISYDLPIIVHLRKATHLVFDDIKRLKKLKAVVFHGWPSSATEANSLLKMGVNAYFSIGKALLRRKKTVIDLATNFHLSRLITETDAPYMTMVGENYSLPADITKVFESLAALRLAQNPKIDRQAILSQIEANFFKIFH